MHRSKRISKRISKRKSKRISIRKHLCVSCGKGINDKLQCVKCGNLYHQKCIFKLKTVCSCGNRTFLYGPHIVHYRD
jgi:hypothetical protein